jgi:hypothetical protein
MSSSTTATNPINPASTRRAALLTLASLSLAPGAGAQSDFPSRPISLLVPFAPGGIADLTARAVAEHMGKSLGQPVVVETNPAPAASSPARPWPLPGLMATRCC